jgi:hypothetical protein
VGTTVLDVLVKMKMVPPTRIRIYWPLASPIASCCKLARTPLGHDHRERRRHGSRDNRRHRGCWSCSYLVVTCKGESLSNVDVDAMVPTEQTEYSMDV